MKTRAATCLLAAALIPAFALAQEAPSSAETPASLRVRDPLSVEINPIWAGQEADKPSAPAIRFFPGMGLAEPGNAPVPWVPLISIRMDDGPVLEGLMWGGSGALFGSFAGPMGTAIGAAVGSVAGIIVGFIVEPRKAAARADP